MLTDTSIYTCIPACVSADVAAAAVDIALVPVTWPFFSVADSLLTLLLLTKLLLMP